MRCLDQQVIELKKKIANIVIKKKGVKVSRLGCLPLGLLDQPKLHHNK